MNRMTSQRVNGIKTGYWSPATKEDLVQRLAAYENTGLEPEEIAGTKSQAERIRKAERLLESVWEEFQQGRIEDNLTQDAVYVQIFANRIVWKLNEEANK